MKVRRFLVITALLLSGAADAISHERDGAQHAGGGWVCTAYGRGGKQDTWKSVTGARKPSMAAAKLSALAECSARLSGCSSTGCWQDERSYD